MAYALPTVAEFKALFPEFTASDPDIAAVIALASQWVSVDWTETDYFYGAAWLAAHYLKLALDALLAAQQIPTPGDPGSGSSESTSTDLSTFLQSVQIGDRKVQWGKLGTTTKKTTGISAVAGLKGATTSDLVLGLTRYGQEFQRLQSRNTDPVLIVGY